MLILIIDTMHSPHVDVLINLNWTPYLRGMWFIVSSRIDTKKTC